MRITKKSSHSPTTVDLLLLLLLIARLCFLFVFVPQSEVSPCLPFGQHPALESTGSLLTSTAVGDVTIPAANGKVGRLLASSRTAGATFFYTLIQIFKAQVCG